MIEFPSIREQLNNPVFNPIEFDGIRKQAGPHSFILPVRSRFMKKMFMDREHRMPSVYVRSHPEGAGFVVTGIPLKKSGPVSCPAVPLFPHIPDPVRNKT
jgi:hypothetical protein